MNHQIGKLTNNIEIFYKKNQNTPRIAMCLNIKSNVIEFKAGVETLLARLFMQGTKNRTSEELATELDSSAIEFSVDARPDYFRFKFVCLNEDFEKAVEILSDILKNSTFNDFEKELIKTEGEIIAELDSPRTKVADKYYSSIFENHKYGYTNSKILENLKNITKEDILFAYEKIITNSKKVISIVGDFDYTYGKTILEKYLADVPVSTENSNVNSLLYLTKTKYGEIIKPDVNQAHIIKGWITESSKSKDYYTLLLLNIILGASGLSSRLFLELRDKKGLAYVVRSSYETFEQCGNFYIYIATEPANIEVSLTGFEEEISKIKNIPIGKLELENAKNNMLGKWAFTQETNENQAILYANYGILGLGYDFKEKSKAGIKLVTSEDIMRCANKYFNDKFVLSILKP